MTWGPGSASPVPGTSGSHLRNSFPVPQAPASPLTYGSIPRSSKTLSPAVPKFCPQLPEDPAPSQIAHGPVLSCPKILFPAISRFFFLFELFQESVPSWAKVLSLAMGFFPICLNSLFLFQLPPQWSNAP